MTLAATALVTLPEAKNFIRKDAASSLQIFAEPVGTGNGTNKTFTLDNTPVAGSLKLYVGGTLQVETTNYSLSTATITFVTAPGNGVIVTAAYDYAASDNTFEDYDDTLLETLINAATKKCEDFCGRAFIQRAITENRIGDSNTHLYLNKKPVSTFTSITLGGASLTEDTDFTLYDEEGLLLRPVGVTTLWSDNPNSYGWTKNYKIVVTYTAGYGSTRAATQALVPDAVLAVLTAVANWYENRLGIKSEAISGIGSQTYDIGELPEQSKRLLSSINSSLGIF